MIKIRSFFLIQLFFFLYFYQQAYAFPWMVRHGYVNCNSCHFSPSGGGILTPYGREISGSLLSTWASERESKFAHDLVSTPEWLNLGGDIRAIEIYRNTPQVQAYRFLNMQEDLEAALTYGKFTGVINAGLFMQQPQLRRFYLNYRPSEQLSVRAGKFRLAYGLMDPDHTTPINRGLGWDEGSETYNAEVAWLGENLNLYLTLDLGPLNSNSIQQFSEEKGLALRVGVPFTEYFQIGTSYFYGSSTLSKRNAIGPFLILGFANHFFLLSEVDYQNIYDSLMSNQTAWMTWNRLDYEFIQGLHGYLTYGLKRSQFQNASIPSSQSSSWGLGSQWFPRPHFEFDLKWQLQSTPAFPSQTLHYATLLFHYYL